MDAGTTSAYRNRKRPLNGRPCNPKVKRRLFPADVPCPKRRAAEAEAEAEMQRSLLKRQRRVIAQAEGLVDAAGETMGLLVDMGWYSYRELDPLFRSIRSLVAEAMCACGAAGAPVEVRPDLYESDSTSYDDDLTCGDDSKSREEPPAFVESGRAALVPVRRGDDAVRGKRRAKANSKYYGPEWAKK